MLKTKNYILSITIVTLLSLMIFMVKSSESTTRLKPSQTIGSYTFYRSTDKTGELARNKKVWIWILCCMTLMDCLKRLMRAYKLSKQYHPRPKRFLKGRSDWPLYRIHNEGIKLLFDPFFTTKDVGNTTDLGLNSSYEIVVNQHNGDIWIQS